MECLGLSAIHKTIQMLIFINFAPTDGDAVLAFNIVKN
jgi:hypothetical protein